MDVNTLYTYIDDHFGLKTDIWKICKITHKSNNTSFLIIEIINFEIVKYFFFAGSFKKTFSRNEVAKKILEYHTDDQEPIISNFQFQFGSRTLFQSSLHITLDEMGWVRPNVIKPTEENIFEHLPEMFTTTKSLEPFLEDFFGVFTSSSTSYFLK
jgi:hypothetical protein